MARPRSLLPASGFARTAPFMPLGGGIYGEQPKNSFAAGSTFGVLQNGEGGPANGIARRIRGFGYRVGPDGARHPHGARRAYLLRAALACAANPASP